MIEASWFGQTRLCRLVPVRCLVGTTGFPFNIEEPCMPTKQANSRKLSRSRSIAFTRQCGRCCYCGCLMWLGDPEVFCQTHQLKRPQAKALQCTGEHLQAKRDGGDERLDNIAAACLICNRRRHARKRPIDPAEYAELVQRRVAQRRWHPLWVFERGLLPASSPE